jgi:hypothetical protein
MKPRHHWFYIAAVAILFGVLGLLCLGLRFEPLTHFFWFDIALHFFSGAAIGLVFSQFILPRVSSYGVRQEWLVIGIAASSGNCSRSP